MVKKQKNLLEESVSRRMMGLAGIGSLSNNFIRNTYRKSLRESADTDDLDEVKTDDDLEGRQTEKGARLSEMPEDDMGGMPPEDDMSMDEPVDDLGGEDMGGDVDVASLVTALADVIETHTGVPVDVEGAEDEMGMDEPVDDMGGDFGDDVGSEYPEDEMMEAADALAKAGYKLHEKSGKYFKEAQDDTDQLDETKKVQKEGDEEELDEEAQELKSQMPNDPGKVKTGSTERVKGAEKPGPVESSHPDHTLKNAPKPSLKTLEEMERRVMGKVLLKLKEELASRKGKNLKKK